MKVKLSTITYGYPQCIVIHNVDKYHPHYPQIVDNFIHIVDNFTGTIECYMVTASTSEAMNFNVFVWYELYFYFMEDCKSWISGRPSMSFLLLSEYPLIIYSLIYLLRIYNLIYSIYTISFIFFFIYFLYYLYYYFI